jgi:hypothetical protein
MHSLAATLFLAQYAATLFMTGLIWFVQIVHYPLFASVNASSTPAAFRSYAARHASRTGLVVFPPMFVELLTALAALLPGLRPAFLSQTAAVTSATLVVLIWVSTGLLQVPLHNRLAANAKTQETIRRLVLSNWLRTALWSARAVLVSVAIRHAAAFTA